MPIAVLDQHSCWKTCQISFLEEKESGQDLFTGKWPREGMIVSGKLYQQKIWEHLICENGGGVLHMWLTPTAVQIDPRSPEKMMQRQEKRNASGRETVPPGTLQEQVMMSGEEPLSDMRESKMWPTPTQDSATERTKKYSQGGTPLPVAVKMWPTPTATETKSDTLNVRNRIEKGKQVMLCHAVRMWPTPQAFDAQRGPISEERYQKKLGGPSLVSEVAHRQRNWPTPTVQDSNKATKRWRGDHQNNLTAAVFNPERMFPTPTKSDYKGAYKTESLIRKDGKSRAFDKLPNAVLEGKGNETVKGNLNPDWVEWLMGYPPGFTNPISQE